MNRPSALRIIIMTMLGVIVTMLGALVFVAIAYLLSRPFLAPGKPQDMFIQLFSTFVGSFLALAVGGWLFRYQVQRTDYKRREELRSLLKAELSETLEKVEETRADNQRLMLDYVQPLIIEEAVKSALFDSSLSQDMLKVAKTYHRYNFHVAHMNEVQTSGLLTSPSTYTESEAYSTAEERLRRGENELAKDSRALLNQLCL